MLRCLQVLMATLILLTSRQFDRDGRHGMESNLHFLKSISVFYGEDIHLHLFSGEWFCVYISPNAQ